MNQPFLYVIMAVGAALVLFAVVWAIRDSVKSKKLLAKADTEKEELLSIIADAELMVDELNNFSDYILTRIDEKNVEAGEYLKKLDRVIDTAPASADEALAEDARRDDGGARAKSRRGRYTLLTGRRTLRAAWRAEAPTSAGVPLADGISADVQPAGVPLADAMPDAVRHPANGDVPDTQPADIPSPAPPVELTADTPSPAPPEALSADGPAPAAPPAPLILYPLEGDGERPFRRGMERGFEALSRNKKYADVISRAEEGMGGGEIARELGIGRGEVELILGLRKA